MPSNADVVAAARLMIGTPWRHQGRVPNVALDCIGLVLVVGYKLDLTAFNTVAYQRDAAPEMFMSMFRTHGKEIPLAAIHPGAVVALRDNKYPCHCGIIGSNVHGLTLIHAFARRRRVVEEQLTRDWLMLTEGVFEYPGVSDG